MQIESPYLRRLAEIESGMNPMAQNPNSSARGLFQLINSTGQQYGLDPAQFGTNAYTQAEIPAAEKLTQDNRAFLIKALGREPTAGELYLAHQQGATGAAKILANPQLPAVQVVGQDAVLNNAGTPDMTSQDFANKWVNKFNSGFEDDAPLTPEEEAELAALEEQPLTPEEQAELAMLEAGPQPETTQLTPAPEQEDYNRSDAGLVQRINEANKKRYGQIDKIVNQAVSGQIGDKEGAFRIGLKIAQIPFDIASELGVSAFRALPDAVENPIRKGASNVYSALASLPSMGGGTIGETIPEELARLQEKYPVASGRIGSVLDAGNLLAPFIPIKGTSPLRAVAAPTQKALTTTTNAIRPTLGAEQKLLQNMGVRLTSGQRSGGLVKSLEDKATSIPIVGDAIVGAQKRSIKDFNVGVGNEVLSSIGKALPKKTAPGRQMVSQVYEKIDKSYDDVLNKMTGVYDNDFVNDWQTAVSRASLLPESKAEQVSNILNDVLKKRAPNGVVDGRDNKEIMRRLTKYASTYGKSLDPDQQLMGEIFADVKNAYSSMLERNNTPELAKKLKDTDLAFAKYVRLEKASGSTGNDLGVFTPAQLQDAVKMSDNSVRRGAFARGDSLLQDISDAGKSVLPNKYPDSGTAGRTLMALGTLGAGAGTAIAAPWAIPLLGAGALAAGAYTRPGQAALRSMSDVIRK